MLGTANPAGAVDVPPANGPFLVNSLPPDDGGPWPMRAQLLSASGNRTDLPFPNGRLASLEHRFSPNGSKIAWVDTSIDRHTAILNVLDSEGVTTPVHTFTDVETEAVDRPMEIAWSPSGDEIAVALPIGDVFDWKLHIVDVASKTASPVPLGSQAFHMNSITWSPSGETIAYINSQEEIFGVSPTEGGARRLVGVADHYDEADRDKISGYGAIEYMPDGRLAFSAGVNAGMDPSNPWEVDWHWKNRIGVLAGASVVWQQDLPKHVLGEDLAVSPDGSMLTYLVGQDSDDGPSTRFVSLGEEGTVPATTAGVFDWQPCPASACVNFSVVTKPTAPRIGTAVGGAVGGKITATGTWSAPTSDGGTPVTSYKVQAQKLNASGAVVRRINASRVAEARKLTMVLPKARYKFRVAAINAKGQSAWSSNSNIVRAR